MNINRRLGPVGIRRNLRGRGARPFAWPASTIVVYDARRGNTITLATPPDVTAVANLVNAGFLDVSELTASKMPHKLTGPDAFEFNLAAVRGLKNTTQTIFAANTYPTTFAIFKFVSNGAANRFQCAAVSGAPFSRLFLTYRAGASLIDVSVNTVTAGVLLASVSFAADGNYHLVRSTLTPTGAEISLDAGTPVVAPGANGGMAGSATQSAIGTDTSDFGPADGNGQLWAWMLGATPAQISYVEQHLLAQVP